MISAVILAGGKATRMGGVAKHALVVDGIRMIDRQLAVLAPLVDEVIVSMGARGTEHVHVARDTSTRDVAAIPPHLRVVHDDAGSGPLAGIAAGLAAAHTPWLLVVACDLPYLSTALVERMIARLHGDAVGLRVGGLPEPLVCALRVAVVRPVLAARLAAGRLKASGLLTEEALDVTWIDEPELRALDPELRCLHNVNRVADLP